MKNPALVNRLKRHLLSAGAITITKIRDKVNAFIMEVVEYFINCLYENKKPTISLEDGLDHVKVMVAIEKSVLEGRPVYLRGIK